MKVNFAVLAEYANLTADGRLNIMGVFNRIYASTFPARHVTMQLVMRLAAHPAEYGKPQQVNVRLANADGHKLFELGAEITVTDDPTRLGYVDQILGLNNIPFATAGDYSFDVLINNNHEFAIPLQVGLMPPPPAVPPTSTAP